MHNLRLSKKIITYIPETIGSNQLFISETADEFLDETLNHCDSPVDPIASLKNNPLRHQLISSC